MILKEIKDEDFVNYRKPSMFLGFPRCSFKCDIENGKQVCQNSALATSPDINVPLDEIIERYINNPITEAIVIGGLEPFDTFTQLYKFIKAFRNITDDDIVVYTGYYEDEIEDMIDKIAPFHVIIKFGRFIEGQTKHYDTVLGVELASENQYAEEFLG
jgi:hypothetical protein